MTAKGKVYKALDEAFRAAFLLTGSTEVAENAYIMWAGSPYAHVHVMGRP